MDGTRRHTRAPSSTSTAVGPPEARPASGYGGQFACQCPWGVAVNQRTPGHDVVDVDVAIDIFDPCTPGTVDEWWVPPDRTKRPDGAIDPTRKDTFRTCEESIRTLL